MSFSTEQSIANIARQHSYRQPTAEMLDVIRQARQLYFDLALFLDANLPPSRERSLAMTALEESRMWANNAAVFNGEITEPLKVNK
jgi:hypothetical protein